MIPLSEQQMKKMVANAFIWQTKLKTIISFEILSHFIVMDIKSNLIAYVAFQFYGRWTHLDHHTVNSMLAVFHPINFIPELYSNLEKFLELDESKMWRVYQSTSGRIVHGGNLFPRRRK